MNCFNHTQEPAVAQCSDCGKGLCSECAERYQPILCTPCFQKRKRSEIWRSIFNLLFLIALFVIGFKWNFLATKVKRGFVVGVITGGFKWNFLATKGVEDMRWMSGYVLMAIWSGYLFVEKYIPYKMMAGTNGQWIVYYIVKLLLFVVIGVFTAPFTCLWAVFRVIKAFR